MANLETKHCDKKEVTAEKKDRLPFKKIWEEGGHSNETNSFESE